mgnify:FL=1
MSKQEDKQVIGELSIQYDEEGNGTLSLDIFQMIFGDDIEVDLEKEMSEKDIKDLQDLLSEMNNIVISKINDVLERKLKEEE